MTKERFLRDDRDGGGDVFCKGGVEISIPLMLSVRAAEGGYRKLPPLLAFAPEWLGGTNAVNTAL